MRKSTRGQKPEAPAPPSPSEGGNALQSGIERFLFKSPVKTTKDVEGSPPKGAVLKRNFPENEDKSSGVSPAKKRSTGPRPPKAAHKEIENNLKDTLRPGLILVMIGLNPGITTALKGQPYAHPSNGFWKHLHTSGITPIQHRPQDYILLPDLYAIGNTNICARPTRLGSELSTAELREGAQILDEKIAKYQPQAVCITGKGVWESMWKYKTGKKKMGPNDFEYGWQPETLWLGRTMGKGLGEVAWGGARTFVAPSTSGLNAGMNQAEKDEVWKPIGVWMKGKREARDAAKGA